MELPPLAVPPQKADHARPFAFLLREHTRRFRNLSVNDWWLPLPAEPLWLEDRVSTLPQQAEVPEEVLLRVPKP